MAWSTAPHRTMANYYMEDFEVYSELFRSNSIRIVALMRILDEQLINIQLTSIRPRDLYKMALDIMYNVDNEYREKTGKEDNLSTILYPYMSKDEVWAEMRTMLQQELGRYFNGQNK